ncbi:hypothetical protein KIW84_073321 [Lathyrus oleraceus]|uniref:Reverse transcriptase domain-containing protein n=1 Tax=Pisum sativum TaxID=3888 RepID=A0A9D4VNT3_PEA|nr:hypothetical protein KIW84_073321 [Pisum sativum]
MSQKDKETFKEYAHRWQELAAQIVPLLEEKEMTKIFLKTLSSFYYERMIANTPSDFTEMVNMGMRLEEGVREGRLTREEGSSAKRYGAFGKKKDGEAHVVTSHVKPRRPSVRRKTVRPAGNQHQVAHIAPVFRDNQQYQQHQQYQQQQHRPQQQAYQPRNNNQASTSYERKRVTFDPIPMTYVELYPSLIERKLITPRDPPAIPTNPQWWYKPELHCIYHFGAPGHDVENCYLLKTKVQDLVRCGILCFEDVGPNVKKNPLPEHGKSSINMVQGCPGNTKSNICRVCTVNQRGCRQVRKDIQEMLDEEVIEILQNRNVDDDDEVNVISLVFRIPEPVVIRYDGSKQKAPPSLIIKPAGPLPYSSDKAVPYRYNVVALEDGKEMPLPSTFVVNITNVSGLTRSGHVFSAPPKPQVDVRRADVAECPVGNAVNAPNPALVTNKPASVVKTPASVGQSGNMKEDCDEILRLIKRSEYNVVDQLLQTPSKISVLSLLMNSEPHREALQKVLDVAYVDHDVTIGQFDNIVANITACNNLSFCDVDLPEEGRDHNLALHIFMSYKDDAMSNVLVDTGSSLIVLPKSTLAKLSYQGPPMRQSGVVVKAFDGSRKTVIGEVELPVEIGPSDFQTTFQIDVEDEVGTPFQALSIAEPTKKGTSSFASYNDAKLAIEHGTTTGLGQMIKLEDNKSRAGIGYSSGTFNKHGLFKSGGFIHTVQDEEVAAIVEEDAEEDSRNFIIPKGLIKPIEHNNPTPSPNFEFPVFEAEEDDVEGIPDEITRLLEHEEKIIQPHLKNLETVNLGSEDYVREVKIGLLLEESVKKGLIELLREYIDVFAWSYEDMPGLDTDIVQHFLPLKPECVPVKQKLRRTHPDMAVKIKEEVHKQIDVGFLVTSTYPQWVANIVLVPKKDGKVGMCVDYRDLNKASPKDDFPLPHIDMLVDNTVKFNVFSFMDRFSGYNQIKMAPEDMEKTTFITPWGTFCYRVMPFGLKNA